jgi:hypothetical protein
MKTVFLILLLAVYGNAAAQPEAKPLLSGAFRLFSVDETGHLYVVTQDGRLKKFSSQGDSMGVFNDVRKYGRLTMLHTGNPLRTLLFYRDFRTVVVLDRFLQPIQVLDFRKNNLFQVRAVAPSYDNHIWVFDEQESKLKKIGESGKILMETADLRIALDAAPIPVQLIDQNGFVYLYDEENGLFIFDYYGAFKGRIALLGWQNIQISGSTILGTKEGKLLQYTQGTLELKEKPLPVTSEKLLQVLQTPKGLFVLTESGIKLLQY